MAISRKAFLGAAAGGSVLILLQACGGGGGGGDDDDDPAGCGASGGAITGNHGHRLNVPAADLTSATSRTYNIRGSGTHAHTVTFTPAQLRALDAGQSVTVNSTVNDAHSHAVTARCA